MLSPAFIGSEPVTGETDKWAGIRVFGPEESSGLRLMQSLSPEQRQTATIGTVEIGSSLTAAFHDNLVLGYEGLPASDMTADQRRALLDVIGVYIDRMSDGHAQVRMAEIEQHLDQTHFAWVGATGDDAVFYYRVHSPVVVIEFDHQRGVALDNDQPSRSHIHTIVRTPNGNDYGKDLLRQHYETAPHHQRG